ncbi:TIGR02265 family protein [Nannocystaceae bacterium ST9]
MTLVFKLPLENFEETALLERLAMVEDSHTMRGLPFRGLAAALRAHCGPAKMAELMSTLGIGPEFDISTRYPLRRFLEFELAAARAIAVELGDFDLAVAECGAGAIDLFFDSRAGQAMRSLSGRSPHRMLSSVSVAFQLMVNFGERNWTKTGENSGVFTFRNEMLGCTHVYGNFEAALTQTYGIDVDYGLVQTSLLDFEFHMRW